ncbi:MAG: hypothetical protein AAF589_06740 [Planctomycetota bacterium]
MADMTPADQLKALNLLKGPSLSQIPIEVAERGQYVPKGGTEQRYTLSVTGRGLSHTFVTDDKAKFDAWPQQGVMCFMTAALEPTRDGTYRIAEPTFTVPK